MEFLTLTKSLKALLRVVLLPSATVLVLNLVALEKASAQTLFFGGRDRVGTIVTGAIAAFPTFGFDGSVNALTFDDTGTLFANVVGTGVGVVDTTTGVFILLAPAPLSPDPGCCIESLFLNQPPVADAGSDQRVSTGDNDRVRVHLGWVRLKRPGRRSPDLHLEGVVWHLGGSGRQPRPQTGNSQHHSDSGGR